VTCISHMDGGCLNHIKIKQKADLMKRSMSSRIPVFLSCLVSFFLIF
jgi:hypothetical protein